MTHQVTAWSPCGRYTVKINGPVNKNRIINQPTVLERRAMIENGNLAVGIMPIKERYPEKYK